MQNFVEAAGSCSSMGGYLAELDGAVKIEVRKSIYTFTNRSAIIGTEFFSFHRLWRNIFSTSMAIVTDGPIGIHGLED